MDRATAITRIGEIDAILAAGIRSATIDDVTVEYDLSQLRAERSRLYSFLQGGRVRVGRWNINRVP